MPPQRTAKDERSSSSTHKNTKTPKHLASTGISAENYFALKVHVKDILLPGTPGFEGKRFDKASMDLYRGWLNHALETIGPKFFRAGGSGLVWPGDNKSIYKTVHKVVYELSWKMRKARKMKGTGGGIGAVSQDAEDEAKSEDKAGPAGDIDVAEAVVEVGGGVVQREALNELAGVEMLEQSQGGEMIVVGQDNQDREATVEEQEEKALGLEQLYILAQPGASTELLDLNGGDYINWDELIDFNPAEPIIGLTFY
ncbi:hypothetical protein L873DRAFT_1842974 [Choiromyces venosus 120613-1]|uniref:Uncharacterized protein n=1 Tax=Choiromyces venosus 120613-1 TaxID=1336337 RepID=A0A3N4JWS6_9PEZI|nr:hypothetical protein L873DRAFT_1842974 [Choiromyces venosus 120613-1]